MPSQKQRGHITAAAAAAKSSSHGPYTVLLLDDEGCEVSNTEESSLKLARLSLREKLVEPGSRPGSYHYGDAVTARILDKDGVILHDVPVRFPHSDPRVRQAEGDSWDQPS